MPKYTPLETFTLTDSSISLHQHDLPELVHLNDPAFSIMTDFHFIKPCTINKDLPMDDALNEMKIKGVHLLLVKDEDKDDIIGIISSEDLLGEKPIQLLQERRISRSHTLVKMLMSPIDKIPAFSLHTVRIAKVGNIIKTLKQLQAHNALVVDTPEENPQSFCLRGIFSTSQISRQLQKDIENALENAHSVSELQKRHT